MDHELKAEIKGYLAECFISTIKYIVRSLDILICLGILTAIGGGVVFLGLVAFDLLKSGALI